MTIRFAFAALALFLAISPALPAQKDTRCFEMRTYYAAPGKLDALNARFRDHTLKLFEKHGMQNIGYWVPMDNKENKLIYLLAYPSRKAREKSWKAFMGDPEWQRAWTASKVDGPLVKKVNSIFLTATDYSPEIRTKKSGSPRLFELRTYTASPGNLSHLNARFRDHTVALFKKHGITNIGYWNPSKGQAGADNTLVYIIAAANKEGRNQSFDTFRKDPAWIAARKASEEKAGGGLTIKGGVKSEFLKPTSYSPIQ